MVGFKSLTAIHDGIVSGGLSELTGSSHAKLLVIEDSYVGEHIYEPRAQLRSIPLLKEFGFSTVIHTEVWNNEFKPVDYTHLDPAEVDVDEVEFPLVHVVSQEGLTEYDEQHLVRSLLRRRDEDDIYIVVTDTNAPSTPAYTSGKSFVDEFVPNQVLSYDRRFEQYVSANLRSALSISDTKNLYYHQISSVHNQVGAPARTLPELFDYDRAPPESPAWEPLFYFVRHDLDEILERYTERIREALRSWTERGDVQKVANNMESMLTRCKFDTERLEAQRQRNAELYNDD